MKKTTHRKLTLNRETLRALQPGQLARAAGGTAPSGAYTQCYCQKSQQCAPTDDCKPPVGPRPLF
jgi:hypothetical protein